MEWRRISLLIVLASLLWLGAAEADVAGFHLGLTPFVGGADWDEQAAMAENGLVYGGRLGIFFSRWFAVEGHYGHSPTETFGSPAEDLDIFPYGVDAVFNLAPGSAVSPYVLGGWTELKADAEGEDDPTFNGWEVGGGIRFMLNDRFYLRTEFRDAIIDKIPDADSKDWQHNFFYTAGLEFNIFGRVPDGDGDGISDRNDKCPGTPMGAMVNKDGCPTDSDSDGVADGLDQCPSTPVGCTVDAKGCPLDSDADGVCDGLDQCASTPTGCTVDAKGCPLDSDADGVCDGLDQCASTQAGATVDAKGCPTDSDGDGVVDGVDLCPNTPPGAQVDAKGCQMMETMILDTGLIRLENITFATGKADLRPESFPVLDQVGGILINWPQLKIEIGGHTDSQGTEASNQKLSERRAQAVLDYLKRKFAALKAEQYTVVGYGEALPIADNTTAAGRAQNRRVEFKVLNTEVLKKQVPADR